MNSESSLVFSIQKTMMQQMSIDLDDWDYSKSWKNSMTYL